MFQAGEGVFIVKMRGRKNLDPVEPLFFKHGLEARIPLTPVQFRHFLALLCIGICYRRYFHGLPDRPQAQNRRQMLRLGYSPCSDEPQANFLSRGPLL